MDRVQFAVNGKKYSVGGEVTSHTTLLDYLRSELELRGTKYMCREGGCGACIVSVSRGPEAPPQVVNSCLVSITSCQDWEVTTIEAVGNRLKGYSEVQKALASHNGTQCGYCSPAWVMTMETLLKNKKPEELTKLEVEKYFSGNICRCTGYRPILDAFKTFAKKDQINLRDIEDLSICDKKSHNCNNQHCLDKEWCLVEEKDFEDGIKKELELSDDKVWYKVTTTDAIFNVFAKHHGKPYMLVGGNTAKGVYPIFDYPKVLIDISGVQELKGYITDQNLILGAGNTLTETLLIFGDVGKEDDFKYCLKLKEHLELVANVSVRNIGTIGGNLMIKHAHHEFPSDVFLLFETVGAMITIVDNKGQQTIDLKKFLTVNMSEKVLVNIILPPFGNNYKLITYKIMPRAQNAKAKINAGFYYKFDKSTEAVTKASIVYGSLNSTFIHAEETEKYLTGKKLNSNETLQGALKILDKELVGEGYTEVTALAKNKIAIGLFYKGLLTLYPEGLNARFVSGAVNLSLTRPVSKGKQVFDTNPSLYPLTEPINKLDGLIQCAGEASYIDDAPKLPHEVFAAFVCSTIGKGEIDSIDAKPALDKRGVIAFYTFKDIPGINSYTPLNLVNTAIEEELCSGYIHFFSEPIGVIVAESEHLADMAAELVKIKYKNVKDPVIDLKEAKDDIGRVFPWLTIPALDPGLDVTKIIKGSNLIGSQYHFHMEKQGAVTKPVEDGIQVSSSSQWMDVVEMAIAQALLIPDNSVTCTVRRVGGAFGAKITRQCRTAIASALTSIKLNRPCRMILPLTTNMRTGGLRPACYVDFQVAVNGEGEIQYAKHDMYTDFGYKVNEPLSLAGVECIGGCYNKKRWDFTGYNVITDRVKSTAMRSPGSLEVLAMTEYLLERISYELSIDPIELRIKNLATDERGDSALELTERIKKEAQYEDRKASVAEYNKKNRWKKRGLRMALITWKTTPQAYYSVNVSVYHGDGSVVITHGGIDMGQGLNTKVIQVCASTLNIPLDKIKVKPFSNVNHVNCYSTGGSCASELVCLGTIKCCEILLAKLEPLKVTLGDVTWEVLVAKAYATQMHLSASYNVTLADQKTYDIFGTAIAEVEIDVLTGEMQVLRVDLLEDVGQTMNPDIDVGQIEGAFIMSLGYWTCEDIIYDKKTGVMITDRTWTYHVPQARDIPQDMRIYFRRHEYNKKGVLGSKATGEPATCLGICIPFAIREAIASSREDSGTPSTEWFDIVGGEVTSHTTLLDYLRLELELRGTKYMCREGGCGTCIVSVSRGPGAPPQVVNSCLVSITSCQNWEVTTIEAVGNRLKGYSEVQKALASHNGTQCGYCSPAWVMTMETLLKNKKPEELTKLEVEKYFSSNICRCTGYRPILDAFKTFAKKGDNNLLDIEDLTICKKDEKNCTKQCSDKGWCFIDKEDIEFGVKKEIKLKDDKVWYSVTNLDDVFDIFANHCGEPYMLVAGNTGKGAYPIFDYPKMLIDISGVQELKGYITDQNLILGAGNTLAEAIDIFDSVGKGDDFNYCLKLKEHLMLVANVAVRNIGTVGGNLMLKHDHLDFPSDLFLLFETVGAMITIATSKGRQQTIDFKKFLTLNMSEKVIKNVILPPFGTNYKLVTFKIMPRAQNAVARINAGFLYKFDKSTDTIIKATIVYGNLNPTFIHAEQTESYLTGKKLNSNDTLQGALKILDKELIGEAYTEIIASAKKKIAVGLFYKGLLRLYPESLSARFASGAINLDQTRPVSKGNQVFDTNPSLYPLTEPINKVEALIQCAGEALYVDDIQKMPYEVHAAFVLSTIGKGDIDSIDAKPALDQKGVIAFYTFTDIPGKNNFTPMSLVFNSTTEEELSSGQIHFFSEPIGILVAETEKLADMAANLVKIKYKNIKMPVLDVKTAKNDKNRVNLWKNIPSQERGQDVKKVIKGLNVTESQYHFHMEKQLAVTKPVDDGIAVSCSTQWIEAIQTAISEALNISNNSITVTTHQTGGAFGAKFTRQSRVAIASALATLKLNRPSRMILPLTTNMRAIGFRPPSYNEFEVGVNNAGEIQYVNTKLYTNSGYTFNEPILAQGEKSVGGCYNKKRWDFTGYRVFTDRVKSCWMRAPGNLEISSMTESIIERISYELSIDPIELRLKNLSSDDIGDSAKELLERIKKEAKYEDRKSSVAEFNKQNRWKKRGLRLSLFKFETEVYSYFDVNLSVYHDDGSVIITHCGIEIGQGINTKVVQVCAYSLNIPINKIKVKTFSNVNNANSLGSGGSCTSELVCLGVIKCCEILKTRLEPLKNSLKDVTWEELVAEAYSKQIFLSAHHNVSPDEQKIYNIFGTAIAEVEIDVLTGEMQVLRVDLVEDVGQSMNPNIDIGQIEGSLIMSQGFWTCEEIIYDKKSGELITDRTWNYHVPQARDIPQDIRIYFRRNEYNKKGVLGSKSTGEAIMCLGICIPFAIREAIASSREDSGVPTTQWFDIDGAHTIDKIVVSADTNLEEFLFN